MARGEDSHDYLLRRLRERQNQRIEQVSRGNVKKRGKNGYWAFAARVDELDGVIALVEEVLFGRGVETHEEGKPRIFDRYT